MGMTYDPETGLGYNNPEPPDGMQGPNIRKAFQRGFRNCIWTRRRPRENVFNTYTQQKARRAYDLGWQTALKMIEEGKAIWAGRRQGTHL